MGMDQSVSPAIGALGWEYARGLTLTVEVQRMADTGQNYTMGDLREEMILEE